MSDPPLIVSCRLIVFVKAPRLEEVKTRLAATVGQVEALAAFRELMSATLSAVMELDDVELRYTPDDAFKELTCSGRSDWSRQPQDGGDLGERLTRAFAECFATGVRRVVAIGSDCPYVCVHDVRTAVEALTENDVVLGPASDGGYWLIALREPQPVLFRKIFWGSSTVLSETRRRAAEVGLQVGLLRELGDVDTAEDWRVFRELARQSSGVIFGAA